MQLSIVPPLTNIRAEFSALTRRFLNTTRHIHDRNICVTLSWQYGTWCFPEQKLPISIPNTSDVTPRGRGLTFVPWRYSCCLWVHMAVWSNEEVSCSLEVPSIAFRLIGLLQQLLHYCESLETLLYWITQACCLCLCVCACGYVFDLLLHRYNLLKVMGAWLRMTAQRQSTLLALYHLETRKNKAEWRAKREPHPPTRCPLTSAPVSQCALFTPTGYFVSYTLLLPGLTSFGLQNYQNSLWYRFNKLLETFDGDFGLYWHDSITQLGHI